MVHVQNEEMGEQMGGDGWLEANLAAVLSSGRGAGGDAETGRERHLWGGKGHQGSKRRRMSLALHANEDRVNKE